VLGYKKQSENHEFVAAERRASRQAAFAISTTRSFVNPAPVELICAGMLAALLLCVAAYYGWRSVQTLKTVRQPGDMPAEERTYYRGQAQRRLINSCLMVILAALLIASYLLGQERQAAQIAEKQIGEKGKVGQKVPDEVEDKEAEKRLLNQYTAFWAVFTAFLLAVLALVFVDLRATRRFGLGQYRQIQADRREMLERETARLKGHERNGH
jgi:cell division protein FtsB